MYYAEIDENGICFAISDMQRVKHPRLIRLYEYQDVLGYTWDGEKWNQPEPEPKTTETNYSETELMNEYTEGVESIG